jgi:hypothetical protein
MTAAPTRNFGVALAQGLGTGAQTYMGTQQQQANIGKTQAETQESLASAGQTKASTSQTQLINRAMIQKMIMSGITVNPDPNGKFIDENGQHYNINGTMDQINSALSNQATNFSPEGASSYVKFKQLTSDSARKEAQDEIMQVQKEGANANFDRLNINKYATSFVTGDKNLLAPGAIAPVILPIVSMYNSIADKVGLPKIDPTGQTNEEIINKMSNQIGLLSAKSSDERSLGALKAAIATTPTPGMNRDAGISMLADQYVNVQKKKDLADHFSRFDPYAGTAFANQFLPSDAVASFGAKHPTDDYEADRAALRSAMASPDWPKMISLMETGTPKQKQISKNWLDSLGRPNLHRYVFGG